MRNARLIVAVLGRFRYIRRYLGTDLSNVAYTPESTSLNYLTAPVKLNLSSVLRCHFWFA